MFPVSKGVRVEKAKWACALQIALDTGLDKLNMQGTL
jgi:hypothetical protein